MTGMNSFLNGFSNECTTTFTENGALTHETTLNHNLDFFSMASAMRGENSTRFIDLLETACRENLKLAVANLFYLRDIREGQGERTLFRQGTTLLLKDYSIKDENILKFLRLIPEYGRWDDMLNIVMVCDNPVILNVLYHLVAEQLMEDLNSNTPSLLAKWFPLPNSVKNPYRKEMGSKLIRGLSWHTQLNTPAKVRKVIVSIREKIKIIEQLLSRKQYSQIVYPHVPSGAMKKYMNAFRRNDEQRFGEYLEEAKTGNAKINASVLYPYEIIRRLRGGYYCGIIQDENALADLDLLWKNLKNVDIKGNILTVVDTSGSMYSGINRYITPIDISVSLGIYTAERNKGIFKDHFITFSEKPKLVRIDPNLNIGQKYQTVLNDANMGYNTNFQKVFDMILKVIIDYDVPPDERPNKILVVSDMEFDQAEDVSYFDNNRRQKTNFETIKEKYKKHGIPMPELVFWNVNSRQNNVPVQKNEVGAALVSGFSPNIMQHVCNGEKLDTPLDMMMKVLTSTRYKSVSDLF